MAKTGKNLIISTGMANLADIERVIEVCHKAQNENIILLQCTSTYPCNPKNANLKAIQTLKNSFACLVGYSDHTIGDHIPVAAVALGAVLIEKHITFSRNDYVKVGSLLKKKQKGPDHKASLLPKEFKDMVHDIRMLEKSMGEKKIINQADI